MIKSFIKKNTCIYASFVVLFLFISNLLNSQTFDFDANKYSFDGGGVNAIVKDNNGNTYVGGQFNSVGLFLGPGAFFEATTGNTNSSFAKVGGGYIYAVVAIPGGGWYIGGDFTSVNGETRNGLARINADGSLHAFNPNMNQSVDALALDGSGNLYVGGSFTSVGGSTTRNKLCKFDNTGALTSFNPNMTNTVFCLAVDGSDNLYVGGSFTSVGGSTTRNRLCKFDNTGTLTSFDPNLNGAVKDLVLDASNNLYVGGFFSTIGGSTPRNYLCKFDNTGALTSFNPGINSAIEVLALDGSGNLYVGGQFTTVGGTTTRNRLCKFDNTGALTNFNPNINSVVYALALDGSGNLYVGGQFNTVGGTTTRNRLCKFDNTGALTTFNPDLNSYVYALATDGSENLYAGGTFMMREAVTRNGLCKFDNTGVLTSFDANFMSLDMGLDAPVVNALAVDGNNNLYVGGRFSMANGSIPRNNLCKFDNTGALTNFNPNINSNYAFVYALALDSNSNLYVGGQFNTVGGTTTRNNLCKFDSIGVLTNFNPNMNYGVNALLLDGSGNLYVGGGFTTVGGSTARNRLCKFDNTGALTNFNPNLDGPVNALLMDGSGNLYVGGNFTIVGGTTTRNRLCKFDNTEVLTNFNPNFDGSVKALLVDGSGNLYVGGYFTTVGGSTTRNRLCKFDNTEALTNFNPDMSNAVNALLLDENGHLYAGGYFAIPSNYLAIFQIPCIPPNVNLLVNLPNTNICLGTGTNISLENSEIGVSYSLIAGTTPVGVALNGTGGTLSFDSGNLTANTTFSVKASRLGCSDVTLTQTKNIIVKNPATYTIDLAAILQKTDATCGNADGALSFSNLTDGVAPYTWSWNNSNTTSSQTNLPAGMYVVDVEDACGKTDQVIAYISSQGATFTFNNITNDESCIDANNGTATANVSAGANGAVSYTWYDITGTQIGNQSSISNLAPGMYNILAVDANGCSDNSTIQINEELTNGQVTITSSTGGARCGAGAVSLSATPSAGSINWYTISSGGTTIVDDADYDLSGNNLTINNLAATTTFYAEAVNGGCVSAVLTPVIATINNSTTGTDVKTACDSYTWIDGNTYNASNNTATYILTNAAGCDSVVTLNLTINNSTTIIDSEEACDTYTWPFNNVTYTNSTNTPTITYTNAFGCNVLIKLDLTINTAPDVSVTNNSPNLTANALGATYQWIDCSNSNFPISGENDASFTATSNGSYAVIVTQNSCQDTSLCITVANVGLTENKFTNEIIVYPNPTAGQINIDVSENKEIESMLIKNVLGQTIFSSEINGEELKTITIEGEAGIYFIELINKNHERSLIKVVKK